MRNAERFLSLALLIPASIGASCTPPPQPKLALPGGLLLAELTAEQKALLRVTLEISDSSLPETDLVLDTEDLTVSGTFDVQNVGDGDRTATMSVYGRFAEDSEEVILGVASAPVSIVAGSTTGIDFTGAAFESCDAQIDGTCSLRFDRNRNGTSNMLDLAPLSVDGRGIDPGEQAVFIEASPSTLQFKSGISLGATMARVGPARTATTIGTCQ